jgi:hypothetical protein
MFAHTGSKDQKGKKPKKNSGLLEKSNSTSGGALLNAPAP